MAQSSNYKQYNRGTRVLTEETGFSGGMLWTGNNIDTTHLKTIVNFDYDDTTGFLTTRDAFIANDSETYDVSSFELPDNLLNYTLVGAFSICALEVNSDDVEEVLDAHNLYLFAKPYKQNTYWTVNSDTLVALYVLSPEQYYLCPLNLTESKTFKSIVLKQMFQLYDNNLYALSETDDRAWLSRLRVIRNNDGTTENPEYSYTLDVMSDDNTLDKFDDVTLLEASVTGFNAGRCEDTFAYESTYGEVDETKLKGVELYQDGNRIISPRAGSPFTMNCYIDVAERDYSNDFTLALFKLSYSGSLNHALWEFVEDVHGAWETLEQLTLTLSTQVNNTSTTYAFALYPDYSSSRTYDIDDAVIIDRIIPYTVLCNSNIDNVKLKYYDLTQTNGSCIWHNHMCVWGNQYNSNTLFISEVDNFYYYPLPSNAVLFDANIINCIPYKDTLLVFTANKIWRLAESNDGVLTQTVVQNDMLFDVEDSAQLNAIKNMVLFKSGNYYYMIVPKSMSLTDELTVAPIYKNIAGLLNNLDKGILEVLQLTYPERNTTECIISNTPTDVYNEQDTVRILYDAQGVTDTQTYNYKVFLNYNTNLRAWTLYLCDINNQTMSAALLTAARKMSFIKVVSDDKFNIVTQQYSDDLENSFRVLLDSGYRTLSTALQKRFREVQLKLYSKTEDITQFGTAFLIDGVFRRNYIKLQEAMTTDNTVTLVPELDLNTFVTELTMPIQADGSIDNGEGSDAIELSDWTLDFSHFKREAPVTIRVPVSGKGYNPRFIFMAPNTLDLYVNEINWAYRLMYGR